MIEVVEIVDPAECRRRANRCREQAVSSNTARTELMEAADTWDELARHAQSLRDAFSRQQSTETQI
jgi:hypothetical protein